MGEYMSNFGLMLALLLGGAVAVVLLIELVLAWLRLEERVERRYGYWGLALATVIAFVPLAAVTALIVPLS